VPQEVLKEWKELEELYLSNNPITDLPLSTIAGLQVFTVMLAFSL
jgi:hypothetical protein